MEDYRIGRRVEPGKYLAWEGHGYNRGEGCWLVVAVEGCATAPEDAVGRWELAGAVGGARACRIREKPHRWVAYEEKNEHRIWKRTTTGMARFRISRKWIRPEIIVFKRK